MNTIFKKLNFKDQKEIVVLNAPASFEADLNEMKALTSVKTKVSPAKNMEFGIAFVIRQQDVDNTAKQLATRIEGDGILWFAYPKGSSKKYKCEFNRDNGWIELGKLGFEPVRMVAIDEDWSALRFRKVGHIKTMTRNRTISEEGKRKAVPSKAKKAGA